MVKDHSDSERGNPLPPHGLFFPINSKVFLYAPSHRQDSTNHSLWYTSRVALAGTRNSSKGPPHEGSIQRPIARWANALTTELHLTQFQNECLTTPKHKNKNKSAIGCQTNGIYIKSKIANVYIKNSLCYINNIKSCVKYPRRHVSAWCICRLGTPAWYSASQISEVLNIFQILHAIKQ